MKERSILITSKKTSDHSQVQQFKKAAREHCREETETDFDKSLGKIGRAKIEPAPKKKPRKPLKIALPGA